MQRPKKTYLDRHRILFHAATIAAHARFLKDGFRQKDLRFLIELFSNWLEISLDGSSLEIENTQIARYLGGLIGGGWAKQTGSTIPRYRLTRDGLVEQLSRLVNRPHWWPIEDYWFIVYFLDSYRERINALIVQAGPLYTGPMKLAIQQLLDVRRFSQRQDELLTMEIAKLELRISDTRKTMALVRDGKAKGKSTEAILEEIQQKVPYQLNNQKPMRELFKETPDENWLWEMEIGSHNRTTRIWMPSREMLIHLRTYVQAVAHGTETR